MDCSSTSSGAEERQEKSKKTVALNLKRAGRMATIFNIVIHEGFAGFQTTLSDTDWEVKIYGSVKIEDEDLVKELANSGVVNRYPSVQSIAEKDYFQRLFNMAEKLGDLPDFLPAGFTLPEEEKRFKDYQFKGACFIAKPVKGGRGENIHIIRNFKNVPDSLLEGGAIVQRYIENPLLLGGLKFDLRLYVIVVGVRKMVAFLADEGLARFTTEPYKPVSNKNINNLYMHLTNYSVNKASKKYISDEGIDDILAPNNATKRTLTALFHQIAEEHGDVALETIKENIEDCCRKSMGVLIPHLRFIVGGACGKTKILGRGYQVFGVDVLVDANYKAWLLEINDKPSLDIIECSKFMGCPHLNCPISKVDLWVKRQVVIDSVKLALKSKKGSLEEVDEFRSLKRVYPYGDDEAEALVEMQDNFLRVSKGKLQLSASDFQTFFMEQEAVKAAGFKRISLYLIFQKAAGGDKTIDVFQFAEAVEALKEKLGVEEIFD